MYVCMYICVYIYIYIHIMYVYMYISSKKTHKPGGPSHDPMSITGKVFFSARLCWSFDRSKNNGTDQW